MSGSGGTGLAVRAARRAAAPVLIPRAARELRARTASARARDDWLDVVYGFDFHGITIRPWQARTEIGALLELLERERPRTVLEIGTGTGGSLYLFARAAAEDALLISVDLHHGQFGGGYPLWRAPLYRAFAGERQSIELVRGDSHEHATFERIRAALGGRDVDFLFVDGDHTYDGVESDFAQYAPLVASSGLIAFHDIVPARRAPDPGSDMKRVSSRCVGDVPEFWRTLRDRYEVEELVEDWEQASFGIGLVRKRALA